jgi:hypothetical protein
MPEKNCDKWHEDNKKKENTRKEENAERKKMLKETFPKSIC